jgi:hypothetical protein
MSKAYAKVIDLIAEGNIDYKKIALAVAKRHPTMFLAFAGVKQSSKSEIITEFLTNRGAPDWMFKKSLHDGIRSLSGVGLNKVAVIREVRQASGMGLYEGKAFVEVQCFENTGMNTAHISTYDAETFAVLYDMLRGKNT